MSPAGEAGGPKRDRRDTRSGGRPGGGEFTGTPGAGPGTAPGRGPGGQGQSDGHGHGGQSGLAARTGPALFGLGVAWVVFALAIPMFGLTTAKSIAVLLGITLLVGTLSVLVAALGSGSTWRLTHAALAGALLAIGIVALVWSGPTFTVVARITAWALLAVGVYALFTAFAQRQTAADGETGARGGTWWVPFSIGAFSLGIGFWAATHHNPTSTFVVLWVALTALAIGLTKFASGLRSASGEEPRLNALTHGAFSGRATGAESTRTRERAYGDTSTLPRGGR